jgi:hypothetical protein
MVMSDLVRLMTFLSLTSHRSSATCEMSPARQSQPTTQPRHQTSSSPCPLTEVVRNNNHTTLKQLDGLGQRVDGAHIEVVRRLVEQEDVRVLHGENGKDDTAARQPRASTAIPTGPIPSTCRCPRRRTYRFRRPSDSWLMGLVWWAPVIPNRPICCLQNCTSFSGNFSEYRLWRCSTGDLSYGSWSAECCEYLASLRAL